MMSLYFKVLFFSILVPFIYSFEPKVQFYKKWKTIFLSIFLMMIPFLIWDVHFTNNGYWGFNQDYLSGIYIFNLPIEEIFFFVVIPYACIFTFYSLRYYFPQALIPIQFTQFIGYSLVLLSVILVLVFYNQLYTRINFLFLCIVLVIALRFNIQILRVFFWVFPIILIPFFIVNGILTGFAIENEVVWYSSNIFMGVRLYTIPLEDVFYAFSLILGNLLVMDFLEKKWLI